MTPNQFRPQSTNALHNETLQTAMGRAKSGFINKRKKAIQLVEDFEWLKQKAQQSKQHAIDHLGYYLTLFETNVVKNGGVVHWAETPEDLNEIVYRICKTHNAKLITKGKSMISEETALNQFLESKGIQLAETDLGEYIIQLAREKPSHIIAPAVHKTKQQVADLFKKHHTLGKRDLEEIRALVDEARAMLRKAFINADVGITGANVLIADSGSIALVTNEGNGDLTATLPKVHIVTASIEKVVADLPSAANILNVLARSATGQSMSTYTSIITGPKRHNELDGPEEFHVVLLDNKRSSMINSPYKEMLRCIKCGACLNHCPVYGAVGGHAYGDVYPGPMGSVLTPLLRGLDNAKPLPNASTFCGRCEEVCPMGIPLPKLLRQLRDEQTQQRMDSPLWRWFLKTHRFFVLRPSLYQPLARWATFALRFVTSSRNRLPRPENSSTFMQQWKRKNHVD